MRRSILVGAAVLSTMALAGCNMAPAISDTSTNTDTSANVQTTIGNTQVDTGNTKSPNWPSDIPTLDAGYNFTYAKSGDTYYLSYYVQTNKNVSAVAADVKVLLNNSGWELPDGSSFESDSSVIQSYTKANSSLSFSVGKVEAQTNTYLLNIISGPNSDQ